ncbi:Hypothetical predicted protein [Xyrichtys novacula]|uniref:Uncharacterized protein n=1 Tax=Xyrichtys novacula TaxID=13765 RepID=A0AAV1FMC8_XYRNO|nr:Hypothetical predicted protein [Xyrichtys novacula]
MINQIDECFKMRGHSGDQGCVGACVDVVFVQPGDDTVRLGQRSEVAVLIEINKSLGLICKKLDHSLDCRGMHLGSKACTGSCSGLHTLTHTLTHPVPLENTPRCLC